MDAVQVQSSLRGAVTPASRGWKKEPSLVWAMARSFGGVLMIAALFKLSHDLLLFASPQILKCVSIIIICARSILPLSPPPPHTYSQTHMHTFKPTYTHFQTHIHIHTPTHT